MAYTGERKRQYDREWRTKRRLAYFEDKMCAVCGSTENLELDHIDWKEKKYSPAALWGMSDNNPNKIAELAKCQVLCNQHHKEKTKADWFERSKHGRTMYRHGCKCEVCCEAQRQHNAQRYADVV